MESEKYFFDKKSADLVCDFFETFIKHIKGSHPGQTIKLEAWQRYHLREIYGWKRKSDQTRRYRTVFWFLPRKTGKSFLGSGLGLYHTSADGEAGAEVYSLATDKEQSRIVFNTAKAIVQSDDLLSEVFNVTKDTLIVPDTFSSYRVMSGDVAGKHGYSPSALIFDELHEQKDRELWDTMDTARGARTQPITHILTTAGYDTTTICYELYQYAKNIKEKTIVDDTFYPVLYEAEAGDDWKSEETWKKANPNYGITVKSEYFFDEFNKAKNSPAFENTFKRLYLNIWTEQEVRWIQKEAWDLCKSKFTEENLVKRDCFVGIDLSSTTDLTAMSFVFPDDKDLFVIPKFWLPEDKVGFSIKDGVKYAEWHQKGYLEKTPGAIVDYDYLKDTLINLSKKFNIRQVALDPWNGTHFATELEKLGFEVVLVRQNYSMLSDPTKQFEKLILSKQLKHNNHPILNWNVGNVSIETDKVGNIMVSKKKSKNKIDGVSATIMAVRQALLLANKTKYKIY